MIFLAKLIEFIGPRHQALIIGWNSPITSIKFNPKNITKILKKQKIRRKSKYKDIIYFSRIDLGFVYSHSEEQILCFDQNLNFYVYDEKWATGAFGKVFRKDKHEKHLYINTFYNQIEVYFGVGQARPQKTLKLQNIPGNCITDFRPLKEDKLLVLSSNGLIMIYEISQEQFSYELVFKMKGRFGGEEYFTVTCNVCRNNKFLAVCSQKNLEMGIFKFFRISEDSMRLEEYASLDLRPLEDASFMYYIRELSLDLYKENSQIPYILGFQYVSDYLMIPFQFNRKRGRRSRSGSLGGEIGLVDDGLLVERSVINRSCFYGDWLWCVDSTGWVYRIGVDCGG